MPAHGPDPGSTQPGVRPDEIGAFARRPFPPARMLGIDTLRWGRKRHHIPPLLQVDVTEARARSARLQAATIRERTGGVAVPGGWPPDPLPA